MKLLSAFLLVASATMGICQTPAPADNLGQNASPGDVSTPGNILHALYDVISGPPGPRNWDRMKSLFHPKAVMAAIAPKSKGDNRLVVFSVDDYVHFSGPYLEKNGFFEHETHRKAEEFGDITQIFSTYESRHDLKDKDPFEKGINSFQLAKENGRWYVVSILWQGDDTGIKVPKKYSG
jgi:hypothetical protein